MTQEQDASPPTRKSELSSFLFTTVILIPGLAVGFVGTYGFIVWITQLIAGPPTG